VTTSADVVQLDQLAQRFDAPGERFDQQEKSDSTRRLYASLWGLFEEWCARYNLDALPADAKTVARYVAYLGIRALNGEIVASTIERKLAAIAHHHRENGVTDADNPALTDSVRRRVRGIKRDPEVQTRADQVDGIKRRDLRRMLLALDSKTAIGLRDRAVLTVGWWGACRRGELAPLELDQVLERDGGRILEFGRTKTDQTGEQEQRAWLPRQKNARDVCAVNAIDRWTARLERSDGPLFPSIDRWGNISDRPISGRTVARIIKRTADAAGLELRVSGHSLRRGVIMQAHDDGATLPQIQMLGRWQSQRMAIQYGRERDLLNRSAVNVLSS
jgi:integrase